jgi:hypothetical protein
MTMPHSVNGIGTTYFGASDRQPDNSFITTEWFILLNIPLIPLRSLRTRYLGQSRQQGGTTKHYDILGPAPLDTRRILQTYAWLLIPAAIAGLILVVGMVIPGESVRSASATICVSSLLAGMVFWVIVFPSLYKAQ